jgi:hypothetical protein
MMYSTLYQMNYLESQSFLNKPILSSNAIFVELRFFRRKSKNFLLHLFYGNIDKIRRDADADILEAEACLGKGCPE